MVTFVTDRYIAIAVDVEGRKHVLGLWLGKGDEGSKSWLSVLTELKNRGMDDVLVVCCDPNASDPNATIRRGYGASSGPKRRYG